MPAVGSRARKVMASVCTRAFLTLRRMLWHQLLRERCDCAAVFRRRRMKWSMSPMLPNPTSRMVFCFLCDSTQLIYMAVSRGAT